MQAHLDPFADQPDFSDAILSAEEPAAWTLGELQESADLGLLRSAWTGADEWIS